MSQTFFFYDLETSGTNPRTDRIMQFAGIRTNMKLEQIGEPYNILIKLADDTLPDPKAIMITGITPQSTQADGMTEAEFAKFITEEMCTKDTIAVGFNNIQFDDEFLRFLLWRNFYDPYDWCWKDGRSRWDLLDVIRMTRALRPTGIKWPVTDEGKSINKLELIAKANNIEHAKAHDALSDVEALIGVTKLIHDKQPQLYQYLFTLRDKAEVKKLVNLEIKQPFVHVSGRYPAEFNYATIAFPLTSGRNGNIIVYDLRHDPTPFLQLTATELASRLYTKLSERQAGDHIAVPIKELYYNRAPAIAPLGVLEQDNSWARIGLSIETVEHHKKLLLSVPGFAENIRSAIEQRPPFSSPDDPAAQLYDSFISDHDKQRIEAVRNASERELADFHPTFSDDRLAPLLLHYKARNFPRSLSEVETNNWETWRARRIMDGLPLYLTTLQTLATEQPDDNRQFLIQELQLWAESIIPADLSGQDDT